MPALALTLILDRFRVSSGLAEEQYRTLPGPSTKQWTLFGSSDVGLAWSLRQIYCNHHNILSLLLRPAMRRYQRKLGIGDACCGSRMPRSSSALRVRWLTCRRP